MVRSRDRARHAALQAEVVALRSVVAQLRDELGRVRAEAAAAAAVVAPAPAAAAAAAAAAAPAPAPAELADVRWVTLQMPLVQLALGDPADVTQGPEVAAALAHPDRGADMAETEIVLDPAPVLDPASVLEPAPADRLAWTVLANLPERPLLDPRSDRDSEPRDPAATAAPTQHRRTA
jgi:hypothetical protein